MCGIVGVLNKEDVSSKLIQSLDLLEYRGYDSAGIATLNAGVIQRCRAVGKLKELKLKLAHTPMQGHMGIGHTRWATHGTPTSDNAHPHATKRVAVVHNGIIENFIELKEELLKKECVFSSETDTEVIVHLIDQYLQEGCSPLESVQKTTDRLSGAYALAIIFADHNDLMIGVRQGSPLVLGKSDQGLYLASDALALQNLTSSVCFLEEGDCVVMKSEKNTYNAYIYQQYQPVEREFRQIAAHQFHSGKGEYNHYMLKEIYQQPEIYADTLLAYLKVEESRFHFDFMNTTDIKNYERILIIACGTSYYAGLSAKYWFEHYAKIACEVLIASEFRYSDPYLNGKELCIFISQSGETIDTLAALSLAKKKNATTIGLVNVAESSIYRQSDINLLTQAGPEIGVASTKALTSQLVVLQCLAFAFAEKQETITKTQLEDIVKAMLHMPVLLVQCLEKANQEIPPIAQAIASASYVLYLGRGQGYPTALEGALKLKEISYIHAEGYAAGELKHGPIALVDSTTPVVAIAAHDQWFEKSLSNIKTVASRGGNIILISTKSGIELAKKGIDNIAYTFEIPDTLQICQPLLNLIPIQLLAYHVACIKGTDVDQPRNLAKSVTVE